MKLTRVQLKQVIKESLNLGASEKSVIVVNPQNYIPTWNVEGLTSDLQMYILFDLQKYFEVFDAENRDIEWNGAVAQRAMEYYYVGVQTMLGCKTIDGRQAYQTTGITAGYKGKGFWAYHIASGQRNGAPLMPHRDHTSESAANVWEQFIMRGAQPIPLEATCKKTGLDFAVEIARSFLVSGSLSKNAASHSAG